MGSLMEENRCREKEKQREKEIRGTDKDRQTRERRGRQRKGVIERVDEYRKNPTITQASVTGSWKQSQ